MHALSYRCSSCKGEHEQAQDYLLACGPARLTSRYAHSETHTATTFKRNDNSQHSIKMNQHHKQYPRQQPLEQRAYCVKSPRRQTEAALRSLRQLFLVQGFLVPEENDSNANSHLRRHVSSSAISCLLANHVHPSDGRTCTPAHQNQHGTDNFCDYIISHSLKHLSRHAARSLHRRHFLTTARILLSFTHFALPSKPLIHTYQRLRQGDLDSTACARALPP